MSIQERHTENRVLVEFSSPGIEQAVRHLGEISANISESNKQLSKIASTLQGQLAVIEKQAVIDERNLQTKHVIYEIERALAYIDNLGCDVDKILNFATLDRTVSEIDTNREYLKDISDKHLMDKVIKRIKDSTTRIHGLNAEDKQYIKDFYDIRRASKDLVSLKQNLNDSQLALENVTVGIVAEDKANVKILIERQEKARQDYFILRFITIIIGFLIAACFLFLPATDGDDLRFSLLLLLFVPYMLFVLIFYNEQLPTGWPKSLHRCYEGKDGWNRYSYGWISNVIFDFTRVITCRSPRILRDSAKQNAMARQKWQDRENARLAVYRQDRKEAAEFDLSLWTTKVNDLQKRLNQEIDDLISKKPTLKKWFIKQSANLT